MTWIGACLLSCSRFCFLRLAMLAPPAAAYIASRVAHSLFLFPSQSSSGTSPFLLRVTFAWSHDAPMMGPCHVRHATHPLYCPRRISLCRLLFLFFFSSLSLPLFFSHSFLCLSGKARNVTELRPFWRPSLRSTSLNRYAASTLKAIHFTLNRIAANQRTRNALFSRRFAIDIGCHVCLQYA